MNDPAGDDSSTSPTDRAYQRFRAIRGSAAEFGFESPDLSEADTRAKLIDPLFRDVLQWSEAEIRREEPSTDGFADYTFGSDTIHLLVEAKRALPRFVIDAPSLARKLKLDGPHLLAQKTVRPIIEQVQRYAADLGAQFAVATNGGQFIIFRPYIPGRKWTDGIAIVFHHPDDVLNHFAEFHRLLAHDNVTAGSLLEAFATYESITQTLFTPINTIQNSDWELIRNPYWSKMSEIMGPLLSDQLDDAGLRE